MVEETYQLGDYPVWSWRVNGILEQNPSIPHKSGSTESTRDSMQDLFQVENKDKKLLHNTQGWFKSIPLWVFLSAVLVGGVFLFKTKLQQGGLRECCKI